MSERDKFIADIIAELNKQKQEDEAAFTKSKKLSTLEIFRKMCFSFPIISQEEILELGIAIDKVAKKQHTDISQKICLDDIFLENVCNLSEKQQSGDYNAAPIQSIAATIFLRFPNLLLSSSKREISLMLSNYVHSSEDMDWNIPDNRRSNMKWEDIFRMFRELVMRSSSSLMSELTAKSFTEGFHLVSLLSVIATFDKFVALTVDSQSTNQPTNSSDNNAEIESIVVFEKSILSDLDDDDSTTALSLTLEEVFQKVIKEVLTTDNIVNHSITDSTSVIGMCKEMWLHCIFLYRDLMVRIPSLIATYLPPLCDKLLSNSSAGVAISTANNMQSLFDFKPVAAAKTYPTSSECMFVVTLCNITTFLTSASNTNVSSTTTTSSVPDSHTLSQARGAVRELLTGKNRLSAVVDICERMNNDQNSIDIESTNYLLDVCMVYVADLKCGHYTYSNTASTTSGSGVSSTIPASKHFECLITSRAMSMLVSTLVKIASYGVESISNVIAVDSASSASVSVSADSDAKDGAKKAVQSNLSSLSSRLLKFLSTAALHSPSICAYLLTNLDVIACFTSVNTSWTSLLTVLSNDLNHSIKYCVKTLDETLSLFAPVDAIALFSVLLLNVVMTNNALSSSVFNAVNDNMIELLFNLLDSSVRIVTSYQLSMSSLKQEEADNASPPSTDSGDYVVVTPMAAATGTEVSAEVTTEEENYIPEEVAEKSQSVSSGVVEHRYIANTMQRLATTISLLTGEADGANLVRCLYTAKTTQLDLKYNPVIGQLKALLQKTLVSNVLQLVSAQLLTISAIEEKNEDKSLTAEAESNSAVQLNMSSIRNAHETLKKRLKTLQSLVEGHTSSKAD